MADTPWLGDACSLVDAFRAGDLSPVEALEASLAAIDESKINAFSFVAADEARAAAGKADVSLPFGGVPIAVKELQRVKGWPFTEASLLFKDDKADVDGTEVTRLRSAGAVLVGLTTAS
jgi:aspartyl-tRNA(Asn)/glutamyl-tRNA(Gln) amidotransferase subunit A